MGPQEQQKGADDRLRAVLRENIQNRMDARWPGQKNQPRKLAAAAGVSQSTIQRFMSNETGMTIDTLAAIAKVFRLQPYKLLIDAESERYFFDAREIAETRTHPAPGTGNRSQFRNQR